MAHIPITVHADLRFPSELIEPEVVDILQSALTVSDPDEMGDMSIMLLRMDSDNNFVIPRGFAHKLAGGLASFGHTAQWIDRRVKVPLPAPIPLAPGFELRPHQVRPVERMLNTQQGIYEAPTGSGKTMTCAAFLSAVQQRSLVLIDKINLADQWADRIRTATGFDCGIIGDGKWDEREITIATRQSLWARQDQLTANQWWGTWGAVIIDECHATSAQTVRELMQMFPAFWRFGVTATPDRHGWLTVASRSILGEIFCRTTEEELEAAGYLVRPKVIAARTPFEFEWNKRADPRREWQRLVAALRVDSGRNRYIAQKVGQMRGKAILVDTDQVGHADELRAHILTTGWPDDRVHMFTGNQRRKERAKIIELMDEGDRVVISTIGKEALDIPRLDRFCMAWPTRNDTRVKQMVGRVRRQHDEKTFPEIWDFCDPNVRLLYDQFADRRGTYARAKMELEMI